ncbi:S9 family peptidase [Puia sp.]|uniref:S9 family peptidase n=1 Tax=Puia sp. TaxID=2045100 RepID=UPI002F41DDC2
MRIIALLVILLPLLADAQTNWNKDGNSYTTIEENAIVEVTLPAMTKTTLVSAEQLAPLGLRQREGNRAVGGGRRGGGGGAFQYQLSDDKQKVLIYTKPVRVYHNTFYTCWVYDRGNNTLTPVAKNLPAPKPGTDLLPVSVYGHGILNAKLSPDGKKLAYVYDNNIYLEDLASHETTTLTTDGNDKKLNGWFDYAYSEELYTIDGFRWSPDSRSIAYWQMDLAKVGIFYMINNTDSIYPKIVPIPFSKVGEPISEAHIGVVPIDSKQTKWMNIEGDPGKHYLPRMEWTPDGSHLIVQQLNRAQNHSNLVLCDPTSGAAKTIYSEADDAWIDIQPFWAHSGAIGWDWLDNGKAFLWASEKDGWRHLYKITLEGQETLLTKGDFDVTSINGWDEKNGILYFGASPTNATQRYLYRSSFKKPTAAPVRVTPENLAGTNSYSLSPNGRWAQHTFMSHLYSPATEWISLPDSKPLDPNTAVAQHLTPTEHGKQETFFQITTADGVSMDGWVVKPANFDSTKKYPVVFYTYSEPAGASVTDVPARNGFFNIEDGYIAVSVEGRGTPVPKGRAWRKSIYKSVGWINVNDQAAAAREILKWPFVDKDRVAVYGSSGGGSTTQNLLFRYPDIYKVGLASAGVPNQLIYNTIYEERFMGVLPENRDAYLKCNPLTYAKGLQGHLLIMHGTGDHNVNYQGEEMLLNELIKYNRQFKFMPYPNRTHGITEGEGTIEHKTTMMHNFLYQYCPPGGR